VPLTDTETPFPSTTKHPFDYFHVNSIQQDTDGNLIVSARNTWAAYKIDDATGAGIWRLGASARASEWERARSSPSSMTCASIRGESGDGVR
jgi:hypothetical protein